MTNQEPDDPVAVGSRLRFLRDYYEYASQEAFARAIGVSRQRYSNWESGAQRLSLDGARMINRLHNISLDFLFLGRLDALTVQLAKAWQSKCADSLSN